MRRKQRECLKSCPSYNCYKTKQCLLKRAFPGRTWQCLGARFKFLWWRAKRGRPSQQFAWYPNRKV